MRRFWGRNDQSSVPRFTRDDDQILALNYENLCDGDYLQRLFVNDPFITRDNVSGAMSEPNRGSASSTESSLLNPEIAEDITLFGDSVSLGKQFYHKRLQRELQQSNKFYDSVFLQISRQVMIYEHMAMVMAKRCSEPLSAPSAADRVLSLPPSFERHLIFTALGCCLRMIRGLGDWKLVNSSHLKSVLKVLLHFLDPKNSPQSFSWQDMDTSGLFTEVRFVFLYSMKVLLTADFLQLHDWQKAKFEDEVRMPLFGIFGLLAIGIMSSNPDDMVVATNFLSLLVMVVEERSESFIRRLKGEQTAHLAYVGGSPSHKALPGKVSAKLKQQMVNKAPVKGPFGNKTAELEEGKLAASSPREESREVEDSNASELLTPKLQSHGSGAKLWDKSMGTKVALEKEKDASIKKSMKGKQGSDNPKMLHEVLEAKDSVVSMPSTTVVNYAITETNPAKSNQGNNNDASPARVQRSTPGDGTAASEIKRIERDVKDSMQAVLVLPRSVIGMLKSLGSALSVTAASPGKKSAVSLLKNKEPSSATLASAPSAFSSRVYSCGQNSYGELGLGDVNMRKSFTRISPLDDKGIVSIGAGNEHSLFVTKDGKLITAGYNDNGQCGVGSTQQVRLPTVVQALEDEEIQQVHVYNGCEHTVAVTKEGKVYSFGYNYRGQLGLGSTTSETVPRPIRALLSRKVVLAACSYHHTVILCSDGTVFSCGRNDSGQLGHGDTVDKKTPQAVLSAPKNIASLSCGQFHSVACTAQGVVYACGKNDYGQLGMDSVPNLKTFSKVSVPSEVDNIAQVCCGYYHTLVLSASGVVGGFGRNDYGQLGLGHAQPKVFQCTVVGGLRDKLVVMVSAGCYHSVTVTVNGMLYVFGRNNHGQLATGDLDERHTPHPVDDFIGQQVVKVAAGFYHTIVLLSDSKDAKKDTQSYVKSLGTDDVMDGEAFSQEVKSLAEAFKKDLTLITGPEDQEGAGASTTSMRSSCRDLLTLLIQNITCFPSRLNKIQASAHLRPKEALATLSATCTSMSILLVMSWENIKGTAKGASLPISVDDASSLLHNVILLVQRTLKKHRALFPQLLGSWKEESGKHDPVLDIIRSETEDQSMADIIVACFGKSFMPFDDLADESLEQLQSQLICELGRTRKILTAIYLTVSVMPKFREECEVSTACIARCLVQTCDVCFGDPLSLCELISILSEKVLGAPSCAESSEETLSPHIRLLSALGGTMHRHEDVVALFRKSSTAGLQIFTQLASIYMHFSKICIDRRLQGHASSRSVDVRRILTVLELTITTMSKSVLPHIFYDQQAAVGVSDGMQLVASLIQHADGMLSQIIEASLSEESLSFLRYGTLIPSILPSVLLYCITFAKRGVPMDNLSQPLRSFIQKLQMIGKYELSSAKTKAAEKKLPAINVHGAKEKDVPASSSDPVGQEAKDDEVNEATAEEILYMRREQHQISWWFRLLKLSVTLSSRMVTLDVKRMRDMFSYNAVSAKAPIWEKINESQLNRDVIFALCSHRAWAHLSWSRDQVLPMMDPVYVAQLLERDRGNLAASPKVLDMCRHHRDQAKVSDSVYRMLSQSTQSGFSGNILHAIEENLYETISIGYEAEQDLRRSKLGRNFRLVSAAIKAIFSKRSALVGNSDQLSWVEVLLMLAKIINILCTFVQGATKPLYLFHALVLPGNVFKSSRARALWRKAITVVMCVQRWSNCLVHGYRRLEGDLVDFVLAATRAITQDLTVIPPQALIVQRIASIFDALNTCDVASMRAARGLANVTDLLEELNSITIRSDVLNSIAASVREVVDLQDDKIGTAPIGWLSFALNCSSWTNKTALVCSFANLERAVVRILTGFQSSASCTLIELQALASAVRLMEILLLIGPPNKVPSGGFSVLLAARLQVFLHEKYASGNNNGEDRVAAKKGPSIRDRNFALKKCIFALLSYSQAYSARLLSPFPSTARSLHEVLQGHYHLTAYLQNVRYVESQMRPTDDLSTSASKDEPKDPMGIPLSPSAAAVSKTKDAAKKRFQDIVNKPMDFSKNSEGLAIAGEKLLNNCKGTDFSVALWVFIKNRPPTNKSVLVMGKFNHNEAWPIVTLKCDGKLEVAYGSNTELERLTSEEALVPCAWTHLTVVVEQKKLKVFINGVPDVQATTTKSNSRAVLFPLVLGSCPANIRSRVAGVREGFDGMIAQCKYYSRALSPIHVKVIFDNGPPETIDISAKAVYHLLASTKALLLTIDMEYAAELIHNIADLCHTIFVTDTNRRNRHAALDLLQVILSKDCVRDLQLSGWRPRSEDAKLYSRVSILSCSFCGDIPSVHARIITYFIRIAGWNWLPFVVPGESSSHPDVLKELCVFSPLTNVHRNVMSQLPDSEMGAIEDRTSYQGVVHGEVSFHVISLLQSLLAMTVWRDAATAVAARILSDYANMLTDGAGFDKLVLIDAVGCALLLGGVPSGGYLGATVTNAFDDAQGRVVNINSASNSATVLSNGSNSHDLKAVKVRLTDLTFEDSYYSMPIGELVSNVQGLVWVVLAQLGPRVALLGRDFLAKVYPDSAFQQKVLLKHLRPLETLIYWKLLEAASTCAATASESLVAPEAALPHLMAFASAAMESDYEPVFASTEVISMKTVAHATRQWFESSKYLESVSDQVVKAHFPTDSEEKMFGEFISKHMGVALDQNHKEALRFAGSWGRAAVALAIGKDSADSSGRSTAEFVVSERALVVAAPDGASEALSDQECQCALHLLHFLRWNIVRLSRAMVKVLGESAFAHRLQFPADLPFWASISPQRGSDKEWVVAENIAEIFNPTGLWNAICRRMADSGLAMEVTKVLTTTVRYAVLSLLQPSSYKAADNLLATVDFFPSLVRNLLCWLEFSDHAADFERLACEVLLVLLPSLPYYESEKLELLMLQVCVHVTRKLAVRVLDGLRPSTELLELVRGANFCLLRQTAQDQIVKYKSHSFNNISALAHNLTQLVSHMEVIQRRGSAFDCSGVIRAAAGSGKNQASLVLAKVQCLETAAPQITSVRNTSFEADLSACAATVTVSAQTAELLASLAATQSVDLRAVVVEVALGVGSAGSECVFETVYCGSSPRLLQSGLMPDCLYQTKCRAYFGSIPLLWSAPVEFRTETGVLFTFDALKSGADVMLSDDQLTASYSGDDNWSTLLGSRSFSSGVTSWEIRVNQSSSAYIFIGIATAGADLNTFLGGCQNSWGFIGEQALYHNREKVKVYGEAFSTGDVVGVTLDLNVGTLSFSKNKKSLGIAFDKIHGDLFPAVAFYNLGQELQLLPNGFKTSCAHEPIPISPARLSMDDVSAVNELLLSMYLRRPLSHRLAVMVAEHCNQWCATIYVRCRAVSQKDVFLATESPLLKRFGLVVGERVRTHYGVAEVAGSAYNRIWFRVNPEGEVWFFTAQQVQEGRARHQLFARCTYDANETVSTAAASPSSSGFPGATGGPGPSSAAALTGSAVGGCRSTDNLAATSTIVYDAATVLDLLEPSKWTEEMDDVLLAFYLSQARACGVEPWQLTAEQLFEAFRALQQQLTRVVLGSTELTHRWGIAGPKRKAVVARLGLLRALNQLLEMYLPFFISDKASQPFPDAGAMAADEFMPVVETFRGAGTLDRQRQHAAGATHVPVASSRAFAGPWPPSRLPAAPDTLRAATAQELWMGPLHALRRCVFSPLKLRHFFEVLRQTTTRPMKTDDDYDYPENLPHVKINRLKSFRAREAAELMQISGEDLLLSSMFCQLRHELRPHSTEKLRISYTHPMDDGQSRSFKIKFEGEGVDDYGGPYREIFGQICAELQLLYPGAGPSALAASTRPVCFLPLLVPAPNWTADGDIEERYVFVLQPGPLSALKRDLFCFLGQLVGLAVRSRITLDLALPSFVWKTLAGEALTERDLASFDQPAWDFVQQLRGLLDAGDAAGSAEALEAARDLTWTATRSDGAVVELVPGGARRAVVPDDLGAFLQAFVTARLEESQLALRTLRQGLVSIVPESALSLLSHEDLRSLVCGSKEIDVDRLQMNTEYDDDVSPQDSHIVFFWDVLRSFDEAEKSAFLKFVWARPSLPPEGVDFAQKMRVLNAVGDEAAGRHDLFLPKAHTCFFSINLPKYSSREIMAEKLRYAIFNCTEMDGDFRTTEADVVGWDATLLQSDMQLGGTQSALDLA